MAVDTLKRCTDGRPPTHRADEVAVSALRQRCGSFPLQSGDAVELCRCEQWPETVDQLSDDLAADGLDGEELVWAVVSFEAQHHIKLIWHEAHKLTSRHPDRTAEDMFGWGWLGLRAALRAYDPALGFRFATYACQRVSGAIRDGLRSEQPVPKRLTTFARKVSRTEEELVAELGRTPTLNEIAHRLHERVDTLRILPRLAPAASLDETRTDSGVPVASWPVDDTDPADTALMGIRDAAVRTAVNDLAPEDGEVIKLLYFDEMTVSQIAEHMGISPRQVRSRMARAREQLVSPLSSWM